MPAANRPALAADVESGLRPLKLAEMRRTAPELLVVGRTQRWTAEEFLQTLVDTEIAARGTSLTAVRLRAARVPRPEDLR